MVYYFVTGVIFGRIESYGIYKHVVPLHMQFQTNIMTFLRRHANIQNTIFYIKKPEVLQANNKRSKQVPSKSSLS